MKTSRKLNVYTFGMSMTSQVRIRASNQTEATKTLMDLESGFPVKEEDVEQSVVSGEFAPVDVRSGEA